MNGSSSQRRRLRIWPGSGGSIRNQLIALNILTLAVLLGGLGLVVRITVRSFMLSAVDRELESSAQRLIHPPPGHGGPFGGPPGGPDGFGDDGPGGFQLGFQPHDMGDRPPPPGEGRDGRDAGPQNPNHARHEASSAAFSQRSALNARDPRFDGPPPIPPHEEDPRYSPQRFDLKGASLAPPGRRHTLWDSRAFALAKAGHQPVTSTVVVGGEPYEVLSVSFPDHGPVEGVVQVPYPLNDVNLAIDGLNRALLMLIPVALLCAGLGGAFLTNRVLGRVNRVRLAAERMGAQALAQRLPVIGNDEFSRLAETFNGLLGRLEGSFAAQQRLLEQQRRFTADASHELKTPLTIIKGNTSMALSGRPSENVYRESMQEIDEAADTMSHLVQDLLLLARSDGGQLGRNRIELPAREILERAISRVARTGVAPIRLCIPDETLLVMGNEAELIRLFTNLLDNAARYTPSDGQITVSATARGSNLVVTIADTGCGIAAEHLPHLGERFYRADSSRARPAGGTGLGLSICKSLAEAHGGHLAFQSTPGVGTVVTVTLPTTESLFRV